jgi:hypothetical protein
MAELRVDNETSSKRVRNYTKLNWVLPLVSGILLFITVLTPFACYVEYGHNGFWWMWDFISTSYGTVIEYNFIFDLDLIIPSIITTTMIVFCAINLFILARKTKLGGSNFRNYSIRSIISALLSVGVMIYFIFSITWNFQYIWHYYDVSFGVILPFVSAALSLLEIGVYRYLSNKKESSLAPQELHAKKNIRFANFKWTISISSGIFSNNRNNVSNCLFR